jgi:hypothetical protein
MTSKKPRVSQPGMQPENRFPAERPSVEPDDSRLDEALAESFPASDPIAVDVRDPHAPEKSAPPAEKKER